MVALYYYHLEYDLEVVKNVLLFDVIAMQILTFKNFNILYFYTFTLHFCTYILHFYIFIHFYFFNIF